MIKSPNGSIGLTKLLYKFLCLAPT